MKSTPRSWGSWVVRVCLWGAILFEVVAMGGAGAAKFLDAATWSAWFSGWGYPPGFSYVVGTLEVAGALLLIPPRSSSYAGGVLIVVMLGALVTVLLHPGRLGPGAPLIHMAVLVPVVVLRWRSRWRPGDPERAT